MSCFCFNQYRLMKLYLFSFTEQTFECLLYAVHSARGWKNMKSSHSGWCWKCEIPGRLKTHKNHIIKIQIIKFCENKENGATNSDWESIKSFIKEMPFELHLKYWELTRQGRQEQILSERNHKFKCKELLGVMSIH